MISPVTLWWLNSKTTETIAISQMMDPLFKEWREVLCIGKKAHSITSSVNSKLGRLLWENKRRYWLRQAMIRWLTEIAHQCQKTQTKIYPCRSCKLNSLDNLILRRYLLIQWKAHHCPLVITWVVVTKNSDKVLLWVSNNSRIIGQTMLTGKWSTDIPQIYSLMSLGHMERMIWWSKLSKNREQNWGMNFIINVLVILKLYKSSEKMAI